MTDFVARLARKWCPHHSGKFPGPAALYQCACSVLATAIREALEAAEKIGSVLASTKKFGGHHERYIAGYWAACAEIAAAIAALQGDRDA